MTGGRDIERVASALAGRRVRLHIGRVGFDSLNCSSWARASGVSAGRCQCSYWKYRCRRGFSVGYFIVAREKAHCGASHATNSASMYLLPKRAAEQSYATQRSTRRHDRDEIGFAREKESCEVVDGLGGMFIQLRKIFGGDGRANRTASRTSGAANLWPGSSMLSPSRSETRPRAGLEDIKASGTTEGRPQHLLLCHRRPST